MLKYAINELTTGTWTLEQDIECLARLGIGAIGVRADKLNACGAERAAALLRDRGLAVVTLAAGARYDLEDPAQWPGWVEDTRRLLALASSIGAQSLQVFSGRPGALSYEEAEARFKDVLRALLPEAKAAGVPLAIEHNHALRTTAGYIHSLNDALDLADEVDSPYFTICAEIFNAWIERRLYDNIRERFHRISLVQLSDFSSQAVSLERLPLGEGDIPLARIVRAFLDAGYDGYFDIEIYGARLEQLGYEEAIRACVKYLEAIAPPA